jgi:hypothetical protein
MTSRALDVLRADSEDLFYSDAKNACVQSIPVEYNTRYTQDFSNKSAGSSTFIIPPGNGLRCPIVVMGFSSAALAGNTGLYALPRGWGYDAIARISWRIGGSSQYFLTGQQLLQRNMRMVSTKSQADAILSLSGNECKVAADFAVDQFAYIPLTCWAGPSADGITLPLPADLLSQQVQITVELNPPSSYFVTNTNPGALVGAIPSALTTAYFQAEQLVMVDKAQSLANEPRFAAGEVSYSMPTSFDQQEQVISLSATTSQQSVVLTGFRAGQVRSIECWLVDKRSTNVNPLLWTVPKAVTLSYAGVIYDQYNDGSAALWNLIDGTKPAAAEQSVLAQPVAPGAMTSSAGLTRWLSLPLGQKSGADYSDDVLAHGKEITNGIVNLQVTLADAAADGSTSAYELHVVYNYNAALNFARGTSEYVF